MAWKYWMIAATGACAFTMTVGAAQSAPLEAQPPISEHLPPPEQVSNASTIGALTATALVGHTATGCPVTLGLVGTATRRACPVTRRLAYTGLLRSGTSRLPYSPTVRLR
jgi:hypothetical protein